MKFSAVAFDLDGTLYPNFELYSRLVPFLMKEQRLLRALDKARRQLRKSGAYEEDFYDTQGRLMAEILYEPVKDVMERTERLIYRGWEPLFKKIRLFPHVKETLDTFRKEGIKLGILSDFPPEIKLQNLQIDSYWDVVVCSEKTGKLKPHPASFLDLAGGIGEKPEDILYVGNSISYDVEGAQNAGMKAALIQSRWKKLPVISGIMPLGLSELSGPFAFGSSKRARQNHKPDFTFFDYRQLRDYVLS